MPMAMQAWMPQPSTFLSLKVDVYKDGSLVGSATYEHQVCESGGDTNGSNVTTTIF